jgi:phytoene dehydrogenase-like protein
MSFSSRKDPDRSPPGYRSVTMSTHLRPSPDRWVAGESYKADKLRFGQHALRSHFEEVFPNLNILFEDYGSPKTFVRYTRRQEGTVGGIPLTQAHTLFRSLPQRSSWPSVFQIGDTSFPGQSVYACAIGACAVSEKILGRKISLL